MKKQIVLTGDGSPILGIQIGVDLQDSRHLHFLTASSSPAHLIKQIKRCRITLLNGEN
jgi:hypothetical protein